MNILANRDKLLQPISAFATKYNISPNMVSIAGVISMAIFGIAIYSQYNIISLLFLAISVFADLFDGSLARFQHKETNKGRMFDLITDTTSFTIFMLALVLAQNIALSFAIIIIILQILVTIKNTRKATASIHHTGLQIHELHGFWILPSIVKAIMYASFIISLFSTTSAVPIMRLVAILILAFGIIKR